MPVNAWIDTTIGEQATLQRGIDITKAEQRSGKVPVVSSGGVASYHDTAIAEGPGVVLGRKGVVGSVYFIKEDYWPHDTSLWVKNFHGNYPRFVYYFFKSVAPQIAQMDVGSANPTLNRNHVHPISVSWPPIPEQKAIAAVLGSLDDKIELNRRMNATLEAMARALFQSWFVDFDPVCAKLEDRPLAYSDETILALFPAKFKDSELGQVPSSWEVRSLGSRIDLLSGGTPKTSVADYWHGNIPWYSVKDAPSNSDVWVFETEKNISQLGIENSATRILPEKTTIISARGTVGKLALTSVPMAMNQSCYGVRGKEGLTELFTYFLMRSAVSRIQQHTHGTVFDTITRQTFDNINFCFPPAELAAAFDRAVEPFLLQIRANLYQSRTLSTLRDTLLPKLLSGKMRISDVPTDSL